MRAYTKSTRYVDGVTVYRDGNKITSLGTRQEAEVLAEKLNRQFGDLEAYQLLNALRDEITLYEEGEFTVETIVESIKAILDSRQKN